ncbi:hypothetical protein C1H46_031224 [Malus baccata]|uniref:fructose-bisphosphate aldolase n=1 Tax=Malus baccata TaxID=106549 RepID=A0A540LAD0_MALBA|nr:hypothetical protein C1H46_031224 [Malus baccata]
MWLSTASQPIPSPKRCVSHDGLPDTAEQEYRKKILRDLNSLISGVDTSADDDTVDQEVTDTEWFFLVSMTQSFVNGGGLLVVSIPCGPSALAVKEAAWGLARYAAISRDNGLVPAVEPETLLDEDHPIEGTLEVAEKYPAIKYEKVVINNYLLLMDFHALLYLCCKFLVICGYVWIEDWIWLMGLLRYGLVGRWALGGSTSTVVVVLVVTVVAAVFLVFYFLWFELWVGLVLVCLVGRVLLCVSVLGLGCKFVLLQ